MSLRVTGLYVYPVKSCAGIPLQQAEIGPRGILHDREFMVVRPDGTFLTQRQLPRLALIRPALTPRGLDLQAPGMPPFAVDAGAAADRKQVTIWSDRVQAIDQGSQVADWLGTYLDAECRLVRLPEQVVRLVDPRFAVEPGDQVGFADGYPLLLISEESLADLNARLGTPLPMNRFRPNVVVRGGGAAYAEDQWSAVQLGQVRCSVVKACARCVITTTDQTTLERSAEPLATLSLYRQVPRGVLFGQNLINAQPGRVAVGDPVSVLRAERLAEIAASC